MLRSAKIIGMAVLLSAAGTGVAFADGCSGRSHPTGTIVGGLGGAAIGGAVGGDLTGALVGGAAGALVGNAVDRQQDCAHSRRGYRSTSYDSRYYWRDRHGYWHKRHHPVD
jgi:hypothetical protein